MVKLTDFERDIMQVIKKWQAHYMNSPSISELARELFTDNSRVQHAVDQLEEKGYLMSVYPIVSRRRLIVVLYWE